MNLTFKLPLPHLRLFSCTLIRYNNNPPRRLKCRLQCLFSRPLTAHTVVARGGIIANRRAAVVVVVVWRGQSTVSLGTSYEKLCIEALRPLGFSLTRTGGRADRGIDLIGTWTAPLPRALPPGLRGSSSSSLSPKATKTTFLQAPQSSTHPPLAKEQQQQQQQQQQHQILRVVVQCKAHTSKPHPQWVRELEGTVAGAPSEWRQDDSAIGVLCATRAATPGLREAVRMARRGVIWVRVEGEEEAEEKTGRLALLKKLREREEGKEEEEEEGEQGEADAKKTRGKVTQFLWNEAVTKIIGHEMGTGLRYRKAQRPHAKQKLTEEIVLTSNGRIWEPWGPDVEGNGDEEAEREKLRIL